MKRLLICFFALLLLITTCYAYSVPPDTIVYVTNNGEKYHRENCSYLKSSRSMTIAQAEDSGYTPCSRCSPDVLLGEYESNWYGEPGGSSVRETPEPTIKPTARPDPSTTDQVGADTGLYVVLVFFAILFGIPLVITIFEAIRTVVWSVKEHRREKKRKK